MYNDELLHYGVKGMKWGVIKSDRQEYRRDKRIRRALIERAHASSSFSKEYDKTEKRIEKRVNKKIERDLNKTGVISKRTKDLANDLELLRVDKKAMNSRRRKDIETLDKHVNNMVKKYSDRNIRAVKYRVKDGEKYVNDLLNTYEYKLKPEYSYVDGEAYTRYIPTRIIHE